MSNKEPCPFCESLDIKEWAETETQPVRWSDGLGSSGEMVFTTLKAKCNSCRRTWDRKR